MNRISLIAVKVKKGFLSENVSKRPLPYSNKKAVCSLYRKTDSIGNLLGITP